MEKIKYKDGSIDFGPLKIKSPTIDELRNSIDQKQDVLSSSGTKQNIKTINGISLLGKGNIVIQGGGGGTPVQYTRVSDAVANQQMGLFSVGEVAVVGLKPLTIPQEVYAKDIEQNYRAIMPNPIFPMIKKTSLHRLYDDSNNMLYICSFSEKHIFYSICPTDTKNISYTSITQFATPYFYYAEKETPDNLIKVNLPQYMGTTNVVGRKTFVFEMSNGDVLVENEDGQAYTANHRRKNIYKVSGIFDNVVNNEVTITSANVSFSLSLKYRNSRISAFDQITEYKKGCIVLAPYGSGYSAQVYITKDYGDTWKCIFNGCWAEDYDTTKSYVRYQKVRYNNEFYQHNSTTPTTPGPFDSSSWTLLTYVNGWQETYVEPKGGYGFWPLPYDNLDYNTSTNGNFHIHGVAYDKWYNRIWICTGDGKNVDKSITGIWWTDNEGETWQRISRKQMVTLNGTATQIMGVIPMEHCVLFSTDGGGDGYFRWTRNGKDTIIDVEEVYNFLGNSTSLVVEAGSSSIWKNFILTSFAPDNETQGDWQYKGGVVATPNGYNFEKIYEDEFTQGTIETAEIGWSCRIVPCENKLILKADKGGYILIEF